MFNDIQPHEALAMDRPVQWQKASPRPVPGKLLSTAYPDWFEARKANSERESVKDSLGRSRHWMRASVWARHLDGFNMPRPDAYVAPSKRVLVIAMQTKPRSIRGQFVCIAVAAPGVTQKASREK